MKKYSFSSDTVSHTHTNTHTHTLSLTHTHTPSLSLSHTHTHTHTQTYTHTHTHTRFSAVGTNKLEVISGAAAEIDEDHICLCYNTPTYIGLYILVHHCL